MPSIEPSETAAGGRDARGRFGPGNKASKGNVIARKAARLRARLYNAVADKEFAAVVKRVLAEARGGSPWACKLLFAYLLGDPVPLDLLQQMEQLRSEIDGLKGARS